VIDLRQPSDFATWSLPDAVNIPLRSLNAETVSPFSSACVLEAQWLELVAVLEQMMTALSGASDGRDVLLLCYDGDTARVATSILRAKGFVAYSVRGGVRQLMPYWAKTQTWFDEAVKVNRVKTELMEANMDV